MENEEKITIMEVIEEVVTEMCDKYCKYPYQEWDYEDEMLEKACSNCPLNRIQQEAQHEIHTNLPSRNRIWIPDRICDGK